MRIISISREFGSGGRELGKRLADILNFDYYDQEIIAAIAEKSGMDAGYIEDVLEKGFWHTVPLTFRRSLASMNYGYPDSTNLLLKQREAILSIANARKDCIIVGRNADVLLREYRSLNLFVHASMEAKIQRCIESTSEGEQISVKDLKTKMKQIDSGRARTREILGGTRWGEKEGYHLTINTTEWKINELAPTIAEFALRWFQRTE